MVTASTALVKTGASNQSTVFADIHFKKSE